MKTIGVRLYGKNDLRLEKFELPEIREDEILVRIISDSVCMSTYKETIQGADHKRVPKDVAEHPIVIGHEFCGVIERVGKAHEGKYHTGQHFTIQPNLNYKGSLANPGYAYPNLGGDMTWAILAPEVMEMNCLLNYEADAFFYGSLAEPLSCIIGTFHAMYHTKMGVYEHEMGIREGGAMAILAGAGPMGLGAIDYAVHCDRRPGLLVVTDVDQTRLDRAKKIHTPQDAAKNGVRLVYLNTREGDAVQMLKDLNGGKGFDDVLVFAPVPAVIEQGDAILGYDGCLNFFAGPTNPLLSARFNFYNVHYGATHLVGTSGGNTQDMKEAIRMVGEGRLHPSGMVTHVGGLNAVIETTLNLPKIPGGKKLIYPGVSMPLTAIADFAQKGKTDPYFAELARLCPDGLWTREAEQYLLKACPPIE